MSRLIRPSLTAVVLLAGLTLAGCSSEEASDVASSAAGAASSAAGKASSAASTAAGKASSAASNASSAASAAVKSYSLADVKKHNTTSSCWAAVDKNVYDLTKWISAHPGGPDRIKQLCGTDATSKFRAQHDSEEDPNKRLASFKIGRLSG